MSDAWIGLLAVSVLVLYVIVGVHIFGEHRG